MRVLSAPVMLALAMGCGGSNGGSNPTATLSLSLSPSALQAGPCPPTHCGTLAGQDEVTASLRVQKGSGVGVRLDSVAMRLEAGGTATTIAAGQFDSTAIAQQAGTARVEGRGQLLVAVGVHYDHGASTGPGTFTVKVDATDDGGHALSQVATASVSP